MKDKRKVRKSLTAEPELDNRGSETQRRIEKIKKNLLCASVPLCQNTQADTSPFKRVRVFLNESFFAATGITHAKTLRRQEKQNFAPLRLGVRLFLILILGNRFKRIRAATSG
ncbi:MAG: hypothetical protein A3G18_09010 [Rhodospirillales bacterium RIFCSPLOWO2_12_FULL_58_28]|nr:MAG: hypothetical protein A3H92_01605 [Rhodospirillales bacterium RIFCSPLOWO2_02_FULL_58_16]OHC78442.1 MAG: hypothetical protein A3G18_09010 [Rhodospirillales bacterium RIFCSPLOWO2_12_FULL_58_28]